ncbi:MAG: YbaB/EbfC family nucleoid-associated protein [Acutalibacteraceae bacterium]|jgi:DNA-binding YbaB/EbfC family protein
MKARIPNVGGQNNMMQQIQKMQEDMAAAQTAVEESEFTASAGGGLVEATVNGKHQLTAIKINPDAIDPEDPEMLEDFILLAVNEAINKASDAMQQAVGQVTGGLNIPGLPSLF